MSDIFNANEFSSVSDKTWRNFLLESERPAIDAPKDAGSSASSDFAKQLAASQKAELKSYDTAVSDIIDTNNKKVDAANKADKEAAKAAKELSKAGLPDISEQKPLPGNWFDAKKTTGYDNLPFAEQSKIYNDWLDQAHVRVVTADVSKAKTARAELEARVPAPVKPKAAWNDTDIIDKMRSGGNALIEGAAKVGASVMPAGNMQDSLYAAAAEADQAQKDIRKDYNAETLDAEKATAFRKNQLIAKYGSEDAIPAWEGFKQGLSSMTQGGVLQTVGNVGQSLASSAPSVVGNVMRVGGAALAATGAGAVVGVPLMVGGTALATIGGAAATAADVGGDTYDEALKYAQARGMTPDAAKAYAESAGRTGGAAGAAIGAVEGLVGAKFGAGSAAKTGLKAGAKKLATEIGSEAVAEGVGRTAVNATAINRGEDRSYMRGVAEASAQGAIGGAGMFTGAQVLATVTGAENGDTAPAPVNLQNTPAAVQAGVSAASAATNTVAQQAQAAVTQAQAAVQAAQATGDDTQVAAATAALQAATAQAQAVGTEPVVASPMAALQAAAAAQDGLDTAIATGDPVQIEQATQAFNAAVSATQTIAAQTINTPVVATIDPAIAERESLNGVQIRDMLDKVEAIPQLIENNKLGLAGAKQALDAVAPLAGAVGRSVNMASADQQWVKSIKTGAAPIDAIAADSSIDPAQREAAQAVIQAYKTTGTALPNYNKSLPVRGNVAGYISHSNISPAVPAQIALNKKIATPATILHEYLHGLTVRGLDFMNRSRNPEHMDVLEGLDAIIAFISQHPSVTNTRAGGVYATTNNKELLAEALSGRVLPLTSNITVQDIINKGGLTNGAIRGLEILTNRQPTTLLQLFTKARDYILNAMGLAAAKKGSVSDAILSAADIAMEEQRKQLVTAAEFKKNVDDSPFKDEEALSGVPTVRGISGPIPAVVAAAKKYAADAGILYVRQGEYVKVDPARAKRIAQAYEDMPHDPEDPVVKAAYSAMVEQTMAQYQSLVDSGFKFWLYDASTDPYTGSPWDAIFDLRKTKSMGVYSTDAGYGSGLAATGTNPMLADTGITWPFGSATGEQRSVKVNDVFRAVHDVFGHGIEGAGFRAQGEENTWQAHIRLFTGAAVGAVTTETRGQNSWVNYGPKGVENNAASSADTVFAEQKIGLMPSWTWQEGVSIDEENLLPGYTHLGKNAHGNFATSIDQLIVDATPVQDGIYRTANGTVLDTNDSIAQVASNPAVQALLKAQGFDGFRTEAGETFALGSTDAEVLPALDKKLVSTMAQISYSITDPSTTDSQRLKYVAKFLNGTLEPALMDAVNQTGVGLTARAALQTQAPWAEAVHSNDDTLLQVLATSRSDIGDGVAEQARAVLRMYAEAGQALPKVTKISGLIPFDGDTALGVYDPATHSIEISDLADPGHIVHEYLHGVTQLGIDAARDSKDGKALRAVMQHMLTTMRTTSVRAGEQKPYALTNEHELMGDMFKPDFLRIAAQTPIGTPASKQAQAMIAELMGERPGTMIQLLDALIRKIVSFLGVKSVPNNMTELLSRVAARAVDETRKEVNSIDMEVLPLNTVPLSMATLGKDIHGRIAGADYIASIASGVNVQPTLVASRVKALAAGQGDKKLFGMVDRLNDAVHDSQGPAKRWIQSLPISEGARERIINILYLAPGKRDNLLNKAMQENGGDAMVKALAVLARDSKGLTVETVTSWVGHWITANHVAEKNAMLMDRKAKAHVAAVQAAAAKPNDFRLKLKEAEALQAYKDQVTAVSSTDLNAGSQTPHIAGVAGGLNNAQAAALMHNVESKIPAAKLKEIAEHVYDLNAFRLMSDIEHGKANVDVVAQFLKLQDTTDLIALQEANKQGNVTDMMRKRVVAQVRSEYVPMTGHPLASIDGAEDGVFGTGAAQPNSQKSFTMEGRTSGIADNGIATTMSSLIKSASFAGFADFTTAVGEAHAILSPDQRAAVGLSRVDNITGMTRSSDNMLIDGRTNNTIGYVVQDRSVLEAIRKANVESHNSLLEKFVRPVTKAYSYLVTQANPIFGPANMVNDMIERSLTASTREYHTEQGNKITIGATDVVANGPQALAAAYRLARGKPDYTKPADVALRDIAQKGGLSLSRDTFVRDSASLAKTIARVGAGGTVVGSMRKALGRGIESYNNVFDMVSPLAAYMALRQAGVSEIDAAGGSLDLMNFRKGGSHMALFTSTIAFAQPAVTGGANMLKMLGTTKGKVILATSIIGFAAMQMLAAAGAEEDEGGNLLLQLPDYMRNNNINFQAGGYTFSIPVGFGTTRLGNTAARIGIDSVVKKRSLLESLNDIIFEGMVPAVSPLEDVKIKDQFKKSMYMITPTVLKPVASVVMNVDSQGGMIDREKWIDQNKYRHLQGSKTIAPEYRELAALTHTMSGGFIDLTPEATRTFVNGYGVGPFKVAVTELITNPHKESQGKETALPIVGALMSSRMKPINEDAWKGQVREAQSEMDDMRKEHSKLELDKTSEGRVAMRELMAKPEYKLLGVFDAMDKALRNESAQVTRSLTTKQITATAAEQRKDAIRDRRMDAEAQFLVKWRKVKGLE